MDILIKNHNPETIDTFIVVVTFNSGDFIENCIKSIAASDYRKWFLAVVDNNSRDDTVEKISALSNSGDLCLYDGNFKLIRLRKNTGFAAAVNHSVLKCLLKQDTGLAQNIRFLVFVNPDLVLEKDSLSNLIDTFGKFKETAATGGQDLLSHPGDKAGNSGQSGNSKQSGRPKQEGSSGPHSAGAVSGIIYDYDRRYIQNAGGKVRDNFITWHLDRPADDLNSYQVDYSSGALFATKLSYFKKLKGFDGGYRPLYFEELDFCLKIKRLGLLSVVNPLVFARHFECASVEKFSSAFYRHYHKNRIRCAVLNLSFGDFFSKFLPAESGWIKNEAGRDQGTALFFAYFLNFLFLLYNLTIKIKNRINLLNFNK